MSSGSIRIRVVLATPADLPFIDRLRRRDSRALGFLSHQALAEKIRRGFVLIARAIPGRSGVRLAPACGTGAPRSQGCGADDPGSWVCRVQDPGNTDVTRALGFVLHGSLRRPEVRLFQLAVDPDFRGLGVASRLMSVLLRRCRRIGSMGLSLRCREDLRANHFWHHLGFDLHDLESGRRGALFVWFKPLLPNKAIAFHSRWHPCPRCQRTTCGSWTEGGVRIGACDRCMTTARKITSHFGD